ncbi:MAG: thiolase family protein [Acidimicrobiaceae bacterium]|nr:thiolase family protein [Acidimicrobiaceae bacterium]
MEHAVIIDIVRTPGGKRGGKLSGWHAVDLASQPLKALVQRNDLDPALVEDVILGCVTQIGEQGVNIARNAALAAGMPESVCGTTIDRQCGSSQQAATFAAQAIMSGSQDIVIAGGIECMTRIPLGANMSSGPGMAFGPMMMERYQKKGGLVPQGISAEMIADIWHLSREELDQYSLQSHLRALKATNEHRFDNEIIPIAVKDAKGRDTGEIISFDEGIRSDTSLEKLTSLKPAFKENGKITAGNSSQITDGASAALIMSESMANKLNLKPRARFVAFSLAGVDPITMLTGPIPATQRILAKSKFRLDDIDLIEINEAFASVVLAWEKELKPDMERVNVNGGAISLGHPLGASGTRLLATLLNELERSGGKLGLQTMCEGGGQANAMIIERL